MTPFEEKFINKNISALAEEYDKILGANKNLMRMNPSYVDGLKPVQRRALYIMHLKDQGKTFRKLATIAGEVFGRVHPHSPTVTEGALVGLEQEWNNIIPLIDGAGNWGTVSGEEAGASRYIKAKLSDYSIKCFFEDWKDSVVDMVLAYDEETYEPMYLPARYPNILLNGNIGIGYGLGSILPTFNFKEVVEACIKLMEDPDNQITLIPDSPTGCDIIEDNFTKISENGNGTYYMRCKYEIIPEKNMIKITNLPYHVTVNSIIERIADIKEQNGLPQLLEMEDYSGKKTDLRLIIRDDVNPYKFMRKLIAEVGGLEKSYPVKITVINDFKSYNYSIKGLLEEWIKYRREQKRLVVIHKRTSLLAEQRTNDVKLFLVNPKNLNDTIKIFQTSRNQKEIEERLVERYKNTEIRMDIIQAKALAEMRMKELTVESYESYIKKREDLIRETEEVDKTIHTENGIDKLIIAELKEGIKLFGTIRKSNVVPRVISIDTEIAGECILQLSSDGIIIRKTASNVDDEPVPIDSNGFAVKVNNDSSFIAIDEDGFYSFIKVKEIPVDQELPLNMFLHQKLGKIIGLLPFDLESMRCCTLISKLGVIKKIKIADMKPSKRPCIDISKDDRLIRAIVTKMKSLKDILVYTRNGMGQRLDPNHLRVTSVTAKGIEGFKLYGDDEITGCFSIDPTENEYLLYVTMKGKMRLNITEYLPMRDSKHDAMVGLISLNDRDKLVSVVGCNKLDKVQVFFDDGDSEIINISSLEEGTMSAEPKKITSKNAVSTNIVKVKIV